MNHKLQPRAWAAAAMLALGALTAPAHAATYSGLYVFGDSLSDPGNWADFGNALNTVNANYNPYGTNRYSDGMVAAEYLAVNLGLQPTQVHNFAVAGAKTGVGHLASDALPVGVRSQVSNYSGAVGAGGADANALYLVWAGPNDLFGQPEAALPGLVQSAVQNLTQSVLDLYTLGARNFLLPLMPDLGRTPASIAQGPLAQAGGSALTQSFNANLVTAYQTVALALAGEQFYIFDSVAAQLRAEAAITAQGGNVTGMCAMLGSVPCAGNYFYWDGVHPTTATHMLTGQAFAAEVPEPGALLLLATAALAAGAASARRRRS